MCTFVSREQFKRHVSVMPLAALCLAGERRSSDSFAGNFVRQLLIVRLSRVPALALNLVLSRVSRGTGICGTSEGEVRSP